jgi:hypothetical protein
VLNVQCAAAGISFGYGGNDMNLSCEALKKLEDDVKRGDSKAISMVKFLRGEVNAARKRCGMSPFVIDADGNVVVQKLDQRAEDNRVTQ